MTRIVTVLAAALALTSAASTAAPPSPRNSLNGEQNSIFQIDISPEEAQKYLNSPPFTSPQLSVRTGVLPLVRWDDPRFRSAESGPTNGHYWKNGREIENTNDYEEEVYDAQQFHGQDGLGAYAYGYKAPESSKVENRARSGDVSGAYEYKAGNNDIIKVRYWADSEGFHQEDNLPKDLPKPVEEAEDVRQARLAHEKAWQEAAAAAAEQPDPEGEYNVNTQQQYQPVQQYQSSASESRIVSISPFSGSGSTPTPNQFQREGKSYQSEPGPQQVYNQNQGQHVQQQGQNNLEDNPCSDCNSPHTAEIGSQPGQQNQGQQRQQRQQQQDEPEPTGPPRGFFYSFNYPVSILTRKGGEQGAQPGSAGQYGRPEQHGQPGNHGRPSGQQPIDSDTVGVNAQRA